MTMIVTNMSPLEISPVTPNTINIAGTGLEIINSITIDGNIAEILTISPTLITLKSPVRQNQGVVNWTGGFVDVVLHGSDSSTLTISNTLEYFASLAGRVIRAVNNRLINLHENKSFYNWSLGQVLEYQTDISSVNMGAGFPCTLR